MQLGWGNYRWPVNGVKVTSAVKPQKDRAGRIWKYIESITADGFIEGNGQVALSAAQIFMENALAIPFRDLIFYCDSGQRSATLLTNADSITGVVIVDGPNFTDVAGPEYVTQRHFVFTAEADYFAPGVGSNIITEWTETVNVSGGGPLFVCKPALVGPPQRQQVFQQTPCMATQSGSATGATAYPSVPPPIWPFALKNSPDIRQVSPDRRGVRNFESFRTEWTYQFEWPFVLFGLPTPWPRGS